jgi:hypothetical protein
VAATIGAAVLLAGGERVDPRASASSTTPAASGPSGSGPAASAPADSPADPGAGNPVPTVGAIPPSFYGEWVGTVSAPNGIAKKYQLRLIFEPGSSQGRSKTSRGVRCESVLTVVSPAPTANELHLHGTNVADPDDECAEAGRFDLTLNGVGGMDVVWQDAAAITNRATATLRREGKA